MSNQALFAAHRWAVAVQRQAARVMHARAPLVADAPITDEDLRAAWIWPDEAHFLLVAAGHLAGELDRLGWSEDYPIDWGYVVHLRNAWEHDDNHGWYLRDYGHHHGTSAWWSGDPGTIGKLRVQDLVAAATAIVQRVEQVL